MNLKKTLGSFDVQLESGKWKRRFFGEGQNPWALGYGFPYEVESEHRNANAGVRFSKTRAYVAVDEDANGAPVTETWVIRNLTFVPGHDPMLLGPMKVGRGGVVTQNPTPRLDRYDQPSQREHVTPKGKRSKAPTERLKARRVKTHYAKTPGVWANPLVRVKVKSSAQRGKGEPSPRLVARRKTTQKAPEGFYANPAKKRSVVYVVWEIWPNGIENRLAQFEKKKDAVEYGQAISNQRNHQVKITSH